MLYVNIRLKPITKAKVINFLYRVSLQKTFYTWNYKKAGAALVRTINSNNNNNNNNNNNSLSNKPKKIVIVLQTLPWMVRTSADIAQHGLFI